MLLTADLARALGGDRGAQLLAAVVTGTGAGVLAIGHLLSTATPDLLAWTVVVRLVVATLQHDRPRLWLAVGLTLGIGLENKHLVGFLAAGLVVGIAVTPATRHHLRSPWAWAGAAVAVALWLPNLAWQAQHGWPQLELAGDIRDEYRTPGGTIELIGFQVLMLNPLGAVLAAIGARGRVASARVGVLPAGADRLRRAAGRLRRDRRQELLPARAPAAAGRGRLGGGRRPRSPAGVRRFTASRRRHGAVPGARAAPRAAGGRRWTRRSTRR